MGSSIGLTEMKKVKVETNASPGVEASTKSPKIKKVQEIPIKSPKTKKETIQENNSPAVKASIELNTKKVEEKAILPVKETSLELSEMKNKKKVPQSKQNVAKDE